MCYLCVALPGDVPHVGARNVLRSIGLMETATIWMRMCACAGKLVKGLQVTATESVPREVA